MEMKSPISKLQASMDLRRCRDDHPMDSENSTRFLYKSYSFLSNFYLIIHNIPILNFPHHFPMKFAPLTRFLDPLWLGGKVTLYHLSIKYFLAVHTQQFDLRPSIVDRKSQWWRLWQASMCGWHSTDATWSTRARVSTPPRAVQFFILLNFTIKLTNS